MSSHWKFVTSLEVEQVTFLANMFFGCFLVLAMTRREHPSCASRSSHLKIMRFIAVHLEIMPFIAVHLEIMPFSVVHLKIMPFSAVHLKVIPFSAVYLKIITIIVTILLFDLTPAWHCLFSFYQEALDHVLELWAALCNSLMFIEDGKTLVAGVSSYSGRIFRQDGALHALCDRIYRRIFQQSPQPASVIQESHLAIQRHCPRRVKYALCRSAHAPTMYALR